MQNYEFSLIHASYKSQGQAKKIRDYWLNMARNPHVIEHCLGFEEQDQQVRDEFGLDLGNFGKSFDGLTGYVTTKSDSSPSAIRNWNAAAKMSSGKILIAIADDLVPNLYWDEQLLEIISGDQAFRKLWVVSDARCSLKLNNLHRDILPRHPVITRALYESYGFIFDPRYTTVGPDDEWLLEGIKNSFLSDARSVEFHHSIGRLFDSTGALMCGCFGSVGEKERSDSQEIIHNYNWKQVARTNLMHWGFTWRALSGLSTSPIIADEIIRLSQAIRSQKFRSFKILFELFKSKRLQSKLKLRVLKRVLSELRILY